MNKTNRIHIGIFGRRNVGKSSLINKLVNQDIAIVSEIEGTTTDTVSKTMEIAGLGPVVIIDTAGIDDSGIIGDKRTNKALGEVNKIDFGILVFSGNLFGSYEENLIKLFQENDVPYIFIHNKSDIQPIDKEIRAEIEKKYKTVIIDYSVEKAKNIDEIIENIKDNLPEKTNKLKSLTEGLFSAGETILLVTPIDVAAPKGRLILPQVMTIRDIIDNNGVAVVCQVPELKYTYEKLQPKLVITDSQVFGEISQIIPQNAKLTSFSILLARQNYEFENYLKGTNHIDKLKNEDNILILESCSHHVSCDDIGRVKIPKWLMNYTNKKLNFDVIAGLDPLPKEISKYSMVIQCGGCMISKKQLANRLKPFIQEGIPVSNYGMTIAYTQGIFKRAVEVFEKL